MLKQISNQTANNITSVASSCDINVVQQLQYGGITITMLVLLILLVRSVTAFVKAVKT